MTLKRYNEHSESNRKTIAICDHAIAFGGSFNVAVELASALDGNKFRVVLITAQSREVLKTIQHKDLTVFRKKVLIDYVKWMRITALANRMPRFLTPLAMPLLVILKEILNLPYSLNIYMLFRRIKPDVVHINNDGIAAKVASRMGLPHIWHLHGVPFEIPKPPSALRTKHRTNSRPCDHYVAISEYVKKGALESGFPVEKLTVIHNPCGADILEYREQLSLDSRRPETSCDANSLTIGIFGRLVRWKGQLELLKAFRLVLEKLPDARLLIVGDDKEHIDNYKRELLEYVSKNNLERSVEFTGYTANPADYYSRCDVVVHSSIDPEPFGLVIVEAMALSKPVIASDLGAARELIDDGVTGFVISPTNHSEVAKRLIELGEDTLLRTRVGMAANMVVTNSFSPREFAEKFESLYEAVLSQSKRA